MNGSSNPFIIEQAPKISTTKTMKYSIKSSVNKAENTLIMEKTLQ